MAIEYTKQNAKNEKEVDHNSSDEANLASFRHLVIGGPANAAHGQCHRILRVVHDKKADSGDDGPEEFISSRIIGTEIKSASKAGITAHINEVEAIEDHEVDDEDDKEEDDVADGARVEPLTCKDSFLDAIPFGVCLGWPEHGELSQPVGHDTRVENGSDELCKGETSERGGINVRNVDRIIEEEKDEGQ